LIFKATFSAAVIDEGGSILREANLPSHLEELLDFSYSLPSGSEIVIALQLDNEHTGYCS
jgi:hypothetical protein